MVTNARRDALIGFDPADVALKAEVPLPATAAPPAVEDAGAKGGGVRYALEDHTHASRARRARTQTLANGTLTWVYSTPFAPGVVPRIQALAETAEGVTDIVNVQIEGTPTNVSCKLRVNRASPIAATLLGQGVVTLSLQPTPGVTWLHLSAFEQ